MVRVVSSTCALPCALAHVFLLLPVSSSVSDFQGLLFGRGTGCRGVDSHCFLMNGGVAGAEDTQLYGIVIRFWEPAPRVRYFISRCIVWRRCVLVVKEGGGSPAVVTFRKGP